MILRAAALCALAAALAAGADAQTQPAPPDTTAARQQAGPSGSLFALDDVQRQLREQREELEQLRA
ncbi:MAG TPA: hypothetical protein VF508_02235, partial [Pyrinomonadaceae bacterium]